jgi:hypothetical protein
MSTRKIITIVVIALGLIVALVVVFAGGIVGFVFYSIGNSDAANAARSYLRTNGRLKQDIGDVKDFGSIVTGSVNVQDSDGNATLKLRVNGTRKSVDATVDLMYRRGSPWRVVGASYTNDLGQQVELLNPYDSKLILIPLAA